MDDNPLCKELLEREKNFHGDKDPLTTHNKLFYVELQRLSESIEADLETVPELEKEHILRIIFMRAYNFIISNNDDYSIFDENVLIHDDVFNACLFTSLCMFLHDTKRIKGMSLREFIYNHSPQMYSGKSSEYYFDIRKTNVRYGFDKTKSMGNDFIKDEETVLRQARHRLLKTRPVYDKNPEWSGIRKDSEHEWTLYYGLDIEDNDIQDTFKRIRNLYNDIYKEINSLMDNGYQDRLVAAYKKFSSKLIKIRYDSFLKLQMATLEHICEDTQYYGINIYRFEKELRLYNITSEVNLLLKCSSQDEENDVLEKSVIMNGLVFPKLYNDFSDLKDYRHIKFYTSTFQAFMDEVVASSRLLIDEFVGNGRLGDDWGNLLLEMINNMTETIFYNPKTIDYSVTPKSQEMFIDVISAPVYAEVLRQIKRSRYMQLSSLEPDDEI